ncbi:hypothetical protein LINPERPRIM_LOCUS21082 [Linum perenne]
MISQLSLALLFWHWRLEVRTNGLIRSMSLWTMLIATSRYRNAWWTCLSCLLLKMSSQSLVVVQLPLVGLKEVRLRLVIPSTLWV